MTTDTSSLASAYAKLAWADSRHEEMMRIFEGFARPADEDDRPYGIHFREQPKAAG